MAIAKFYLNAPIWNVQPVSLALSFLKILEIFFIPLGTGVRCLRLFVLRHPMVKFGLFDHQEDRGGNRGWHVQRAHHQIVDQRGQGPVHQ